MKKLGLIINPVAGMGGSVGLKGTDHMVEEALRRGAKPRANERVRIALAELLELKDEIEILTYPGDMGAEAAEELGFKTAVLMPEGGKDLNALLDSSRADTLSLARRLKEEGVDLLLFAGGDGTARDIYEGVGTELPALGIPAGVKIHSPVYAKNPQSAGSLAKLWLSGKLKNTLIGVDLIKNRELVANDLYGDKILDYIRGKKTKLVVTVTGGQGFLFGRGNQQITPEVIREIGRENIIIIATKAKIAEFHHQPFLVDTPDQKLNQELCGYYRVVTAYGEFTMCRVSEN